MEYGKGKARVRDIKARGGRAKKKGRKHRFEVGGGALVRGKGFLYSLPSVGPELIPVYNRQSARRFYTSSTQR